MRNSSVRNMLAAATFLGLGSGAQAFMVTLDVMAMPAASKVASSVESTGAASMATAKKNSQTEINAALTNSVREIQQAIDNTLKINNQAMDLASLPTKWVKLVKDYKDIGTGWVASPSTADSVTKALIAYEKYKQTNATGTAEMKTLSSVYKAEIEKYGASNLPYVQAFSTRSDTAAAYKELFEEFRVSMIEQSSRMGKISTMIEQAANQRDYDTVNTLLSFEQNLFNIRKTSFELSKEMIKENELAAKNVPAMQGMAQFTDLRSGTVAGTAKSTSAMQRISFKN